LALYNEILINKSLSRGVLMTEWDDEDWDDEDWEESGLEEESSDNEEDHEDW
jgi:hypothetical protein